MLNAPSTGTPDGQRTTKDQEVQDARRAHAASLKRLQDALRRVGELADEELTTLEREVMQNR